MTVFYFTSTGNSLAVARHIGGTLVSIPQVVDSGSLHYKDDVIGVVFPIYFYGDPKMVRRFLNKVKLEADYIFAVGTCGNTAGASMLNLQKQARKNGYRFDYVNYLRMVDNFLPIFEMNAEVKKLPKKKVEENLAKIADDIKNRRHLNATASLPLRAMTALANTMMNSAGKKARKYIVSGNCNKCGICAKVCPAGNIAVTDTVNFSEQCEWCMGCLHNCPQNALHLRREKSAKRWRHPEVSLNGIIAANNRGS